MMMKPETKEKIAALRKEVKNEWFDRQTCERFITVATLARHGLITREWRELECVQYSQQEVVELLNELEGEDNYYDLYGECYEWIIRDGQICRTYNKIMYKFVTEVAD